MTQPDYFTVAFWRAALNHIIFGAATGALNAWGLGGIGSADSDTHLSIPGWAVGAAALGGAILALLLALVGQAIPGTPAASFVPAAKATRASRPRRRARKPAPTTADLHKPKNPPAE